MKEFLHPEVGNVLIKKNKRSKRITLRIKPNAPVTLTIPFSASYQEAEKVLSEHLSWVKKQQEKMQKTVKEKQFSFDSTFQVRNKTLLIVPCNKEHVYLKKEKELIYIQVPTNWDIFATSSQEIIREAFVKALRIEAKAYLPERTQFLAKSKNIRINDIRIKKVKSRWGSCSSKGNINLSLYLMLLPDRLIDYVILHELAHIKHQNHSVSFWNHLDFLLPGAKQLDKELKHFHIP